MEHVVNKSVYLKKKGQAGARTRARTHTHTHMRKLTVACHNFVSAPTSTLSISFNHSIDMCRMRRFLAVLRSFFHSSQLCTFSCHPSPPTILPSSLTSSCHLFLGLPLNLVVPKFIYTREIQ